MTAYMLVCVCVCVQENAGKNHVAHCCGIGFVFDFHYVIGFHRQEASCHNRGSHGAMAEIGSKLGVWRIQESLRSKP